MPRTVWVRVTGRPRLQGHRGQAPDVPNAPSITAGHLSLGGSWTAPSSNGSDITDYDVRYCAVSGSNCGTWQDAGYTGTTVTTTITGLTNGKMYQVQVHATNDEGTGDWSDSASVVTRTPEAPDAPVAPTLVSDHASLDVSWTAPRPMGHPSPIMMCATARVRVRVLLRTGQI